VARHNLHSQTAGFTEFMLQPHEIQFGTIRKGYNYRATLALTNTGSLTGRFNVIQPQTKATDLCSIQVLYRPGLIAPGLQKRLEVELYAGEYGDFNTTLTIKTEQSVFQLPIAAHIVSEAEYSQFKQGQVSSRKPVTQPPKAFNNSSAFASPINDKHEERKYRYEQSNADSV
jgi:hypothetical protein